MSVSDEHISEAYIALGRLNHVQKKHQHEAQQLEAELRAATEGAFSQATLRLEQEVMTRIHHIY